MRRKVEKTDNKNELKLEFTVAAEKFEEAMKKVYFQTAKYFNIPGFRKGKAPMKIVEKYYGESIFYEDAFNEILKEEYDLIHGLYLRLLQYTLLFLVLYLYIYLILLLVLFEL